MKKIIKKPTITVVIPAYNEQENIGNVLDSLLLQKLKRFRMEKIVVYTDGSTDNTLDIVRKKIIKPSLIDLRIGTHQKGKFYRLNKIYKQNKSDVLIVLDADIALVGNSFVENFAASIIDDEGAMLVSAWELPLIPKTFVGRIIASSYLMWDNVRWSIPNYDHVQNLYARATAYRGLFAAKLHIPDQATEERMYLYLMAKKTNGFRLTQKACIYYWPVTTLYDYVKLSERAFGRPQPTVNKLFGFDATHLYAVPKKYKYEGMIKSFIQDPFYMSLGMLLGLILSKLTLGRKTQDSQIWEISLSTKKSITL